MTAYVPRYLIAQPGIDVGGEKVEMTTASND